MQGVINTRLKAYSLAVLSTLATLLLRGLLSPVLGERAPLLAFVMPVMISAWYGGWGPGLCATLLSLIVGNFFFVQPAFGFGLLDISEVVRAAIFLSEGVIISALSEQLHRTRSRMDLRTRELLQSEERFRLLVNGVKDYAIFMLDLDGRVVSWNAGATRINGYQAEEILGVSFACFYPPVEQAAQRPSHDLRLAAQEGALTLEGWRVRKDDSLFWAGVSLSALYDPSGNLRGFAHITRDLTAPRQAELSLRESEARFRATFNQAAVGIAQVDLEGRWLLVNQRLCEILGYSQNELYERTFQQITYPPDLHTDLEYIERMLANELQTYTMEKRYICKDQQLVWVSLTVACVRNAANQPHYFISVIQDIAARKQIEGELQLLATTLEQRVSERTSQLAEANTALEAFSYSVSHDLRAPLRGMQGLAQALQEDYADVLDATGQEYTQRIVDSAAQMDQLIRDLLAYGRLSRNEIRPQALNLLLVLHEALRQLELEITERQAQITVNQPLPLVLGHGPTLIQVLVNLISNGLKFVPPGTTPQLTIWATQQEQTVRLWIKDNGIGIASQHQARIFGIFERLHGAESYPGTGIGLAMVRKGIERMGGQVGVRSELGQGSQFWLELPHVEANGEHISTHHSDR